HVRPASMSAAGEVEFGVWPGPGQFPGCDRRAAGGKAAMHDYAGDARETVGLVQQFAVLEPGAVTEVVGHDPGEGHPEARVLVPRARFVALFQGHDGVLPVAPVTRR